MKSKKLYTRKPFVFRSIRLPAADLERWQKAAGALGVSQSDFLRQALRERADRVLSGGQAEG